MLELPKNPDRWLTVTPDELVLRRRAYWLDLRQGHGEIRGQKSVTIRIPEQNVLDVEALRELMDRSTAGDL